MKVFVKKEICGSYKQYTRHTGNTPQSQNMHLKKEEEENAYVRHYIFISTQTGTK